MKPKFWFYYLTLVLLFSGLAYVAISDVSDVPLALSDSDMAALQGTAGEGANRRCMNHQSGCTTIPCKSGVATFGYPYRECFNWTGYYCNQTGNMQTICETIYYEDSKCQERKENGYFPETARNCSSRLM